MVNKSDVIKQLDSITDRLSTQVRTVSLGALALSWGLLIGESQVAREIAASNKRNLVVIGSLAVVTMLLDFLQYVFGYINNRRLLRQIESEASDQGEYDYRSFSWKLRAWLFIAKQVSVVITAMYLLTVLGHWMLASG